MKRAARKRQRDVFKNPRTSAASAGQVRLGMRVGAVNGVSHKFMKAKAMPHPEDIFASFAERQCTGITRV